MGLNYILRLFLLILLVVISGESVAANRIIAQAYYEDASAIQDFEQVRAREFHAFEGVLNKGYRASAYWLRLRIDPGPPLVDGKLVLRMRPGYLDDIQLFDPDFPGHAKQRTGDTHPWSTDIYRSLNLNMVIPQGERPRDVWLRLQTTSTSQLYIEALGMEEVLQADRAQEVIYSVYIGLFSLFAIFGAVYWLVQREGLIGAFALSQILGVLYALSYMGYLRPFWPDALWPFSPDQLTSIFILIYVAAVYRVNYLFLYSNRPNRWMARVVSWFPAMLPPLLLMLATGYAQLALSLNMYVVFLSPFFFFGLAMTIKSSNVLPENDRQVLPATFVKIAYALFVGGVLVSAMPALGWVKGAEWSLQGFLFYGLFSGFVMTIVMLVRARRLDQHRTRLEMAVKNAERCTLTEQEMRFERENLLAMLAHELKTPLSVVRMVLGAKQHTRELMLVAERSIKDMDAVLERCVSVDREESGCVTVRPQKCVLPQELESAVQNSAAPNRIQLHVDDLPQINTDSDLLRMILSNLLDNALKYGDAAAPVVLRARRAINRGQDSVLISVSNPPGSVGWPDAAQVFKKYYRSPRAHQSTGSGLGLFLIESLARRLGGDLKYVPTEKEIAFMLWLPL